MKNYCLAPLAYSASVNANTSGVFKGFYKNSETGRGQFGGNSKNCLSRIMKEIVLQKPIFSNFSCEWTMHKADTNVLIKELNDLDVAYYDPPYNQHPYGSNYFMLNLIVDYKEPSNTSKVSGIPVGWNKSSYNRKEEARKAFFDLVRDTNSKYVIISYSTEGILSVEELIEIFKNFGTTEILRKEYAVFKGSRNLRNRTNRLDELLFVIRKK
jgi:adenine-specific DNA-methyltransferase